LKKKRNRRPDMFRVYPSRIYRKIAWLAAAGDESAQRISRMIMIISLPIVLAIALGGAIMLLSTLFK
jgi:hypothetical protein